MNAYVNLENVRLETKRLILRAFQKNDVNDFYEYAKVEGGGKLQDGVIIKMLMNQNVF